MKPAFFFPYLYIWRDQEELRLVESQANVNPVRSKPVHLEQELDRCLELTGEKQDLKVNIKYKTTIEKNLAKVMMQQSKYELLT